MIFPPESVEQLLLAGAAHPVGYDDVSALASNHTYLHAQEYRSIGGFGQDVSSFCFSWQLTEGSKLTIFYSFTEMI